MSSGSLVQACHAGPLMPVSKLALQDLPADWCLGWGKGGSSSEPDFAPQMKQLYAPVSLSDGSSTACLAQLHISVQHPSSCSHSACITPSGYQPDCYGLQRLCCIVLSWQLNGQAYKTLLNLIASAVTGIIVMQTHILFCLSLFRAPCRTIDLP